MLVAAAVCPCPPLLLPEIASGAAAELDDLRAACDSALRAVIAAEPDLLWVVGPADEHVSFEDGGTASFRPFGVELTSVLGRPGSAEPLPPSLGVGAWLLERAGWDGPAKGLGVPDYLESALCAANGARLAETAERVGLLVLGEGSARRDLKAPGYLDPRAEAFDDAAARGLATADAGGELATMDDELAFELMASGRAPWQVLCGASDGGLRAELRYREAPYGVGYFVADWT